MFTSRLGQPNCYRRHALLYKLAGFFVLAMTKKDPKHGRKKAYGGIGFWAEIKRRIAAGRGEAFPAKPEKKDLVDRHAMS